MYVSFHRSYCSIKLPLLSNTTASPMQMHPLEMRGSLRDNPAITDPMLDEPHQPFSAERVEEGADIGVEDPVDLACLDSVRERIQRVVLAASGSEPVTKSQELRLVDRREEGDHGCLDDLVLDGSNAE